MSKWSNVVTGGGERIALPASPEGTPYGNSRQPGLRISQYLAPKPTRDKAGRETDQIRHSFLVHSALNGTSVHELACALTQGLSPGAVREAEDQIEQGAAFLAFNLRQRWLKEDYLNLAFNIQDMTPTARADAESAEAEIKQELASKILLDGITQDAEMAAELEKRYRNLLLQIRISVGTIFRLQDWAGRERDPQVKLYTLEGVKFSATVKHQVWEGKVNAEIEGVREYRGQVTAEPPTPEAGKVPF